MENPTPGPPDGPYLLLHNSPKGSASGSCFGGWWVTVWQSRFPTLQVDRERATDPVVRAVPFSGQVEEGLSRARLFLTTEEDHLAAAARLQAPTVYVADGLADAPLPDVLGRFPEHQLRVVRSHTAFRRDLALRELHRAIEELAPGTLEDGLSESRKCRERLLPHLGGRLADLGHGGTKILSHAIGVDFFRVDPFDHIGDCRDLWFFRDESLDTVYSSHCLEDLWHPHQALDEWTRVLRPGGSLVLFLPLRDFYPNVGTPGANPGHKDDYVPEDVEGFLQDLGHMEVVHAVRQEAENSFEIVAQKKASRTWSFVRSQRPRPEVSVLVMGEVDGDHLCPAQDIVATVESCRASLSDMPHEILVLLRHRLHGDDHAAVRDLGSRIPDCRIVQDLDPLPYVRRVERLRKEARGDWLLILSPGVVPTGDALATLVRRATETPLDLAEPCLVDLSGQPTEAPGSCVLVRSEAFPVGCNAWTPYLTPLYWEGLKKDFRRNGGAVARVSEAVVYTCRHAGRPIQAHGPVRLRIDEGLIASGPPLASLQQQPVEGERVLLCMLKTLGDCVFALPVVDQLVVSIPQVHLTVLTEEPYAWVFQNHPGVAEVLTTPVTEISPFYLQEDAVLDIALAEREFDRWIVLSDRLDNVTYHHSGHDLRSFYGLQAGLAEACQRLPRVYLARGARERARQVLTAQGVTAQGVDRGYAVFHTKAGWPEKCPDPGVFEGLAREILGSSHLAVVVVGGPDERVDVPGVVNLAGQLTQEESAAVIAEANLFVGVDSGCLHIASAFGVPSLAVYAGSSVRVAPPLAPRSAAVQSPGSCALPCGVSNCPMATCCADSIRVEHLLPRLQDLLWDQPVRSEWLGDSPAVWIRGPEGPVLLRSDHALDPGFAMAGRHPAYKVSEPPTQLLPAMDLPERTAPAPTHRLPPLRENRLHELLHQALEPWQQQDTATDAQQRVLHQRIRDTIRGLLGREAKGEVLRCLLTHAARAGDVVSVLQFMGQALDAYGALIQGVGGRPRPAFVGTTLQMFTDTMSRLTQRQDYLILLEQCTRLYEETVGELPDADITTSLMARALYGADEEGLLPTLARVAEGQRAALEDLELGIALDLGKALARLAAWDAAEEHYGQALESASLGARHREPFLLNRALVRSARPEKIPLALEDLDALSKLLEEGPSDARLARTVRAMQENLQKQMLIPSAPRRVPQPARKSAGTTALPARHRPLPS